LSNDWRVQNGWAYDKARLDVADCTTLVVPENAEYAHEGAKDIIEIYMEKALGEYGWHRGNEKQGEPTFTPRLARKSMGCASRKEDAKVILATYGEWSHKEGSAYVKLFLVVPEKIALEPRAKLSGPLSEAQGKDVDTPKSGPPKTHWPVPTLPGKGWSAIPSEPDPKLTAKQRLKPPDPSLKEKDYDP
jgi:hypothetical protein